MSPDDERLVSQDARLVPPAFFVTAERWHKVSAASPVGERENYAAVSKKKIAKEVKKRITYEHLPNAFAGEEK